VLLGVLGLAFAAPAWADDAGGDDTGAAGGRRQAPSAAEPPAPSAPAAEAASEDGCRVTPSIRCSWAGGDHVLSMGAESRFRLEAWDSHKGDDSVFYAVRTRARLKYDYKKLLSVFAEGQDAQLWSLNNNSSGAAGVYRRFGSGGNSSNTNGQDLRQAWLEVRPIEGLSVRGGRTDIKLGTQAMYQEPNWKYVKIKRASQRLVGTVGWTHGERSNDGGTISYDFEGYNVFAFGALPTTGVFDISGAYHTQDQIVYGGVSFTAKRDTWLKNTEFRPFFLAYNDDRDPSDGGLPDGVEVYTFGASMIGIYPMGPGNLDVLVWAAGQAGDYGRRDHLAGAGIVEAGYQLTEVMWKPWFRAGVNIASGGDQSGDHNTFFNMLPTNHLYYGFADQFAFQNLIDAFIQVMVKPTKKLSLNAMFHYFALVDDDDFQYFGTGAFTKKLKPGVLGYGARPSFGHNDVATEIDLIANYAVNKHVGVQAGFSYLWDGDVWDANKAAGNFASSDVMFGYLQVMLKY
jgi:hypothetical protein